MFVTNADNFEFLQIWESGFIQSRDDDTSYTKD